jgi:hypothetical protein
MTIQKLEAALSSFLKVDDAAKIAQLLEAIVGSGKISYEEAKAMIGEDTEDILMLGYGWRLLLPVRAAKAGDWEDRMLTAQPGEIYQAVNVVKHLVKNANKTGRWDPETAIAEAFEDIGEPEIDKMSILVARIASEVKGHRISGIQIKRLCTELGLGDRVDPLLSELKACGIISPKLNSLTDSSRVGTPIYELNPSLFAGLLGR